MKKIKIKNNKYEIKNNKFKKYLNLLLILSYFLLNTEFLLGYILIYCLS